MKKVSVLAAIFLWVTWVSGAACFASEPAKTLQGIMDAAGKEIAPAQSADKADGKTGSAGTSEQVQPSQSLDSATSVKGIKEALTIGIQNAVKKTGIQDGFFKNDLIKIGIPEKLKKADTLIRQLGGGQLSDALVEKMNRAAEKAAPSAEKIFIDAVGAMKIEDAAKILSGSQDAATTYLKEKTSESLSASFYPEIKSSMEEIGAVKTFDDYIGKFASNPLVQSLDLNMDINRYVTDKSINGLFVMVAEEEKKIRENPAARVTDLLKNVFGGK